MKKLTLNKIANGLTKSHGSTDHATFLRALAALSVVVTHFDGFSLRGIFALNSVPNTTLNFIINLGIYGPTIFFIASGFALTASLHSKSIEIRKFILRRYFRLAPLYIFVLIIYVTLQYIFYNFDRLEAVNFVLKILFLDVFFPKYFYNDPIGVLATLPIEFWWSISIPILISASRRLGLIADFFAGIFLFFLSFGLGNSVSTHSLSEAFPVNAIWTYGFCFYLGYTAHKIRLQNLRFVNNLFFLFFASSINMIIELFRFSFLLNIYVTSFLYLLMFDYGTFRKRFPAMSLIGISFGTFCYSVYLVHLPIRKVLDQMTLGSLIFNILSLILILIIAPVTYVFIESKGIKFGERITRYFFKNSS